MRTIVISLLVTLAGCASSGSQQGVGNVGDDGQQGIGLVQQNPEASGERTAVAGGDTDQSTRQSWNDPRPWLAAQGAALLTVGLVVMYWIRHHSYLKQKPQYERMKGKSCAS